MRARTIKKVTRSSPRPHGSRLLWIQTAPAELICDVNVGYLRRRILFLYTLFLTSISNTIIPFSGTSSQSKHSLSFKISGSFLHSLQIWKIMRSSPAFALRKPFNKGSCKAMDVERGSFINSVNTSEILSNRALALRASCFKVLWGPFWRRISYTVEHFAEFD